jgi:molybdopterin-containing oxidoreductase family iron-sulfur binding subunit
MGNGPLERAELRARLAGAEDWPAYWRSLEELAGREGFLEAVRQEVSQALPEGLFRTDRRRFLQLMGAMLALAGVSGCGAQPPNEQIVPYVVPPEEVVPGRPLFYATAMPFRGYTAGLLVESHMGRPIKVEGNPQHPASLGATDSFAQGSLFTLYDPERPQTMSQRGAISTWESFTTALGARLEALRANEGAGLRLLTESVTSPSLAFQIATLREQFPQIVWHQFEPLPLDNVRLGSQQAFGAILNPVYHFDQAARILTLDADFLFTFPGSLRYARDFSDRRRLWQNDDMNRLYVVESNFTITGAKADHRLALPPSAVTSFALALAQSLGVTTGVAPALTEAQQRWLAAVAEDLTAHSGASLVIAGEGQPPAIHALAHAINATLGNIGATVTFTEPVEMEPAIQVDSLRALVEAMNAGQVDTLLILGCNPVLSAPTDLNFAEALAQVGLSIHNSLYYDETSALCHWHIPESHFLEAWGDGRAYDGTASIIQPLIAPLYNSRTPHELLSALLGAPNRTAYEIVRNFWDSYYQNLAEPAQPTAETFWRTALHDGFIAGTAAPTQQVALAPNWADALATLTPAAAGQIELVFRPDPTIWDGRFANNAWLQELPDPLTKLTWDNALLLSPATAQQMGVTGGELLEVQAGESTLTAAAWVTPGHADGAATLYLGYGRTAGGTISAGAGFNAYPLRTSDALFGATGVVIRPLGEYYPLASTQTHDSPEGRDLLRFGTLASYHEDPHFAHHGAHGAGEEGVLPSLYPEFHYDGYAWGMVIDMTACIGCNACTVACMVENNIPVVGKDQVARGREMHWLMIDRYFVGEAADPTTYFQPRLCMHCEKAPCEPVCPVAATVHDAEGLNQMIYNRCVGTRYCSNNCPYKVRRFNFYDYNEEIPLLQMARNPDVTVRERGVMEKCTYCVQRINYARREASIESRALADGEVLTACQAVCPTRAIVFGDINNEESLVAQLKQHPLNYGMLADLGTRPRTTYLAEVRNLNPALTGG